MSSKETGARRRAFTLLSALVIAVALAVLSSGAGATSECEALGTTTFTDPTGDGSGTNAPDISDVIVTSYEGGATKLQIALPGVDALTTDMLVRTYIDSDKNSATGNDKGYEYMIQSVPTGTLTAVGPFTAKCEGQPVSTLYAWDGSGWVARDTETLSSWYGDNSLTLSLNASEIGNALTFNLAVYGATNVTYDESGVADLSSASYDWAPDTGSWVYQPFQWSAYNDPSGDGSAEGAPDITGVGVTKWKGDLLKFAVSIPGTEEFGDDMLMRILIDSDANAATGDVSGYEYMIQAQRVSYGAASVPMGAKSVLRALCYQPSVVLFEWNGESWKAVEGVSFDWWYTKGLELSLDSSVIGSPAAFNFAVYAATNVSFDDSGWPDLTKEPAFDRAPDTGSYGFPLTVSNAELVGLYKVTSRITKSSGHLNRKKTSTNAWNFQKRCAKKKCATKASVKGQGNDKLSRAGKVAYKARAGKKVSCSNSVKTSTTERFSMKVKKSGWVKGKWRVTKWVGTLRVASAKKNASKCGAGSYTASLTGTLKKQAKR